MTIDKLVSLAAIVFLVITTYQTNQAAKLSAIGLIAGVVTGLFISQHSCFWRVVEHQQADAGDHFEDASDNTVSDRLLYHRNSIPSAKPQVVKWQKHRAVQQPAAADPAGGRKRTGAWPVGMRDNG